MSLFTKKILLITGGTGSFGNAVLNRFLRTDIGEIRVFSRDEKKQVNTWNNKCLIVGRLMSCFLYDYSDIAVITGC